MNIWIQAARLRTLPLAISGILLGSAQAYLYESLKVPVLVLGIVTAVLLQILSNYANDYGDFQKGTDTQANRQDRALSSGKLSPQKMKFALIVVSLLSLFSGLALLYTGVKSLNTDFVFLLVLGVLAIGSAIFYTVGKKAYGYFGFGDAFVFIFFGLIAVCGICFLQAGKIPNDTILAAMGCGFLSTGVLNVNNIRDIVSDAKSGKKTLVVRMGKNNALRYHQVLVWGGFIMTLASFLLHIRLSTDKINQFEYLLVVACFGPFAYFFGSHIYAVKNAAENDRMAFNKQLKNLSLSILGMVIFYFFMAWLYAA